MEKAIRTAIEGGYIYKRWNENIPMYDLHPTEYSDIFLDPLFWQALGKALGWDEKDKELKTSYHDGVGFVSPWPHWKYFWHLFIDHCAEGKDIDSFFEELLNHENKES